MRICPATDARVQTSPPIPCDFQVGDIVTFTNDYGLKFHGKRVTGFSKSVVRNGAFIFLDTDAYWFEHRPDELTLEHRPPCPVNKE